MKKQISTLILLTSIAALTACGPRTRVANNAMNNTGKEFSEETPVDYDSLDLPWEKDKGDTDNRAGAGDADHDQDASDSETGVGTEVDTDTATDGGIEKGNKLISDESEKPSAATLPTKASPSETSPMEASPSESVSTERPSVSQPASQSSGQRMKAAWDHKKRGAEFTQFTLAAIDELGEDLLKAQPRDMEAFCPNYSSLQVEDKKAVWLMLISAMAYFESSFNPKLAHQEKFKNSKAEFVVSRGLMQLSRESSRHFGCKIEKEADLEDPKINLSCAVRIMTNHVSQDGVIAKKVDERWRGGARYWYVLRAQKTLPVIRKAVRKLSQCGQN